MAYRSPRRRPGRARSLGIIPAQSARVVPKPYQDPHPPIFQPFSVSENTIRSTARSGIVPWILVILSARFSAPVPALPRSGGGERPPAPARRKRRRLPRRPFRPLRGGGGGAVPGHQLRRVLPLFRRLRLR